MPKISIVMPTYNQEKFICEAVGSILNQSFRDFELIIVNDGSTDETNAILQRLVKMNLPRISVINKENGGTGSALNLGFTHASGKYETWFSSDNIMYPTMLHDLNMYLDCYPNIDYVYANIEIGVMDHTGLKELQRKNIKEEIAQNWDPEVLKYHYFLGISWLWRRELRLKAGPFQIEPCEDYRMVLDMFYAGGRFAFLDKPLAWFRRHGENMSMKINKLGIDYSGLARLGAAQGRGAV